MKTRFSMLSKGLHRKRGEMNRGEAEYAAVLDRRRQDGEVWTYWFEPLTLRLSHPPEGQPAKVTVDFMVLLSSGETHMVDVKGTGLVDPAAIVRIKCAAEQYPLWRFFIATKRLKKHGGGFKETEV